MPFIKQMTPVENGNRWSGNACRNVEGMMSLRVKCQADILCGQQSNVKYNETNL